MIETLTSPTSQLSGANARLLLDLPKGPGGGLHAFSVAQLIACVFDRDRNSASIVACHGTPAGILYGMQAYTCPSEDHDERKAWEEAVEWLLYRGLCTYHSPQKLCAPHSVRAC